MADTDAACRPAAARGARRRGHGARDRAEPLGGLALPHRRGGARRRGFGLEARVLRDDGKVQRTLHPGFTLELFRDQAEGYYLNLTLGRAGVVRRLADRR